MTKPLLNPPCPGWLSDLPGPFQTPDVLASLWNDHPNHLDDIYLEVSRRSSQTRGILVWVSIFYACFMVWETKLSLQSEHGDLFATIGWWVTVAIAVWICLFAFRIDVAPPRDLPIRFNRARQRIYAYNFRFRWWNPFEHWRVDPVAYDWAQVRAERWKKRGVTAQGGIIINWGVVLSIVKPGTNEVIDRFELSTMAADEFAWAYICTYMQLGQEALPPPEPPRDLNAAPWYNLALRLAPKVQWPADMDRESRTAP